VTTLSYSDATAIYKRKILRNWGLTFARGWARVLLSRRRDLVESCSNRFQRENSINSQDNDPISADINENFHFRRRHRYTYGFRSQNNSD
jgi:hypothetical protein